MIKNLKPDLFTFFTISILIIILIASLFISVVFGETFVLPEAVELKYQEKLAEFGYAIVTDDGEGYYKIIATTEPVAYSRYMNETTETFPTVFELHYTVIKTDGTIVTDSGRYHPAVAFDVLYGDFYRLQYVVGVHDFGGYKDDIIASNFVVKDITGTVLFNPIQAVVYEAPTLVAQAFKSKVESRGNSYVDYSYNLGNDIYHMYFEVKKDLFLNNILAVEEFNGELNNALVFTNYISRMNASGVEYSMIDDWSSMPMNSLGLNFEYIVFNTVAEPITHEVGETTSDEEFLQYFKVSHSFEYTEGKTINTILNESYSTSLYLPTSYGTNYGNGMGDVVDTIDLYVEFKNKDIDNLDDVTVKIREVGGSWLSENSIQLRSFVVANGEGSFYIRHPFRPSLNYEIEVTIHRPESNEELHSYTVAVKHVINNPEVNDYINEQLDTTDGFFGFLIMIRETTGALFSFMGGFYPLMMQFYGEFPVWLTAPLTLAMGVTLFKVIRG